MQRETQDDTQNMCFLDTFSVFLFEFVVTAVTMENGDFDVNLLCLAVHS